MGEKWSVTLTLLKRAVIADDDHLALVRKAHIR